MNILMLAVDDLRPLFGAAYGVEEVLTPNIDNFFLSGGGSAFQRSYVSIAVCGPSRASILTGRRPDSTQVLNTQIPKAFAGWCWCQRTNCSKDELFMTLPTYFRQHGYVTAGAVRVFHHGFCRARVSVIGLRLFDGARFSAGICTRRCHWFPHNQLTFLSGVQSSYRLAL
jgi:hypothetical protein